MLALATFTPILAQGVYDIFARDFELKANQNQDIRLALADCFKNAALSHARFCAFNLIEGTEINNEPFPHQLELVDKLAIKLKASGFSRPESLLDPYKQIHNLHHGEESIKLIQSAKEKNYLDFRAAYTKIFKDELLISIFSNAFVILMTEKKIKQKEEKEDCRFP